MTIGSVVTIRFYGHELTAQEGDTPETTLVALKPLVEGMGLGWGSQYQKVRTHPVLAKGMQSFVMPSAGGPQQVVALPLGKLALYLGTIHPGKVPNPEVRDRIVRYQEECADVLLNHFWHGTPQAARLTPPEPMLPPREQAMGRRPLADRTPDQVRALAVLIEAVRRLVGPRRAEMMIEQQFGVEIPPLRQYEMPLPQPQSAPPSMQAEFTLEVTARPKVTH